MAVTRVNDAPITLHAITAMIAAVFIATIPRAVSTTIVPSQILMSPQSLLLASMAFEIRTRLTLIAVAFVNRVLMTSGAQ